MSPLETLPAPLPSPLPTIARAAVRALALSLAAAPLAAQVPSMRPDVMGMHGAVSSDHVLASAVGADVLKRGGNAVDAAIAMAGVLAVVRPHMNGVGGDNFMLIREARSGKVYALNGSGRAGSKATPAFFAAQQLTAVLIVPLMMLFFAQLAGVVVLSVPLALGVALALCLAAAGALWAATRIFQRDTILTRWK